MGKNSKDILVRYRGSDYQVVLGPPCYVEQKNGALMESGMPMIILADPETKEYCVGLTVEIPEAPLKAGQVLVGGREAGLQALTEAGVVRHTGDYYRSKEFDATFAVCDLLIGPLRALDQLRGQASAGRISGSHERSQDRERPQSKPHANTSFEHQPSKPIAVRFKQWDCEVLQNRYNNGRTALFLVDEKSRESVAVATANLPDEPLAHDEVFIKDWSENAGMLQALEQAGIVRGTGEYVGSGFVMVPKAKVIHPELMRSTREVLAAPNPAQSKKLSREWER
jgi:hypothetical protein